MWCSAEVHPFVALQCLLGRRSVSSSFTRLCQTHRRTTNELLPICADVGCFLAPSPEVLVQMVDTCPSVNSDLNKYHLCLRGEHTEGLREKSAALSRKGINDNLEHNMQSDANKQRRG